MIPSLFTNALNHTSKELLAPGTWLPGVVQLSTFPCVPGLLFAQTLRFQDNDIIIMNGLYPIRASFPGAALLAAVNVFRRELERSNHWRNPPESSESKDKLQPVSMHCVPKASYVWQRQVRKRNLLEHIPQWLCLLSGLGPTRLAAWRQYNESNAVCKFSSCRGGGVCIAQAIGIEWKRETEKDETENLQEVGGNGGRGKGKRKKRKGKLKRKLDCARSPLGVRVRHQPKGQGGRGVQFKRRVTGGGCRTARPRVLRRLPPAAPAVEAPEKAHR